MTKVPESPKPFVSSVKSKVILCFPPGTSLKNREHDTKQVEAFIASVRAKRKRNK